LSLLIHGDGNGDSAVRTAQFDIAEFHLGSAVRRNVLAAFLSLVVENAERATPVTGLDLDVAPRAGQPRDHDVEPNGRDPFRSRLRL
jgi:hypothetical protein